MWSDISKSWISSVRSLYDDYIHGIPRIDAIIVCVGEKDHFLVYECVGLKAARDPRAYKNMELMRRYNKRVDTFCAKCGIEEKAAS